MTDSLAARLRKILPATPLPWKELPYKDGGRERTHIDYDDAYELAAANALPTLLDRLEALERQLVEANDIIDDRRKTIDRVCRERDSARSQLERAASAQPGTVKARTRLIYNKTTKRIDKVRDGLVIESFDPPEEP